MDGKGKGIADYKDKSIKVYSNKLIVAAGVQLSTAATLTKSNNNTKSIK